VRTAHFSTDHQLLGLTLLFMSLCFDGGTGAYEDKLMNKHHVGPFDLMFNIQFAKMLLAGLGLVVTGQITGFFIVSVEYGGEDKPPSQPCPSGSRFGDVFRFLSVAGPSCLGVSLCPCPFSLATIDSFSLSLFVFSILLFLILLFLILLFSILLFLFLFCAGGPILCVCSSFSCYYTAARLTALRFHRVPSDGRLWFCVAHDRHPSSLIPCTTTLACTTIGRFWFTSGTDGSIHGTRAALARTVGSHGTSLHLRHHLKVRSAHVLHHW